MWKNKNTDLPSLLIAAAIMHFLVRTLPKLISVLKEDSYRSCRPHPALRAALSLRYGSGLRFLPICDIIVNVL